MTKLKNMNIHSANIIDLMNRGKDINLFFEEIDGYLKVRDIYLDNDSKAVELIVNCMFNKNKDSDITYSGPLDIKAANLAIKFCLDVEDFSYSYYSYDLNYYNCKTVNHIIKRRYVLKEIERLREEYNLDDYDLMMFPSEEANEDIEYIGIYGPVFNYIFKDYNIKEIESRIKQCLEHNVLVLKNYQYC